MTTQDASPTRSSPLRLHSARRLLLGLLVLAALLAGALWVWKTYFRSKDLSDEYQIASVQRADIQDLVTATGTVQPRDYVDVGAQVSGQLKKLHVEVGSVVEAGDLLAEIDPTVFAATVDARRAGLRNQRASLKEKQSQLALSTLQFERQKRLAADEATPLESLQVAEAALRASRAQIEAVKAQIEQTESTLRADEATLNYARIYAPMSGTVVSLTARQGQTLNANQSAPTLMRIADLSTMTVQTQVSEAEVGKLRTGMEVYFTTLGNQNRRWYGQLRKVEPTPTVTNNVVLYNALFDVPNRNQVLMSNMSTQVFFVAASVEDALVVPTAAVSMARAPNGSRGRSASRPERGANAASLPRSDPDRAGGAMVRPASAASGAHAAARFSSEERVARREQRRLQRQEADGAEGPRSRASEANRPAQKADESASAASSPSGRVRSDGLPTEAVSRPLRRGTVKLITADGRIEERAVELGVTTRVQAEVLSGLAEGDRVVTGLKPPPAAAATPRPAGQQGGGLASGQGMPTNGGRGR